MMDDNKNTASRILSVTEEELQRIILNIHDGSVQNIFAALSKVQAIQLRHQADQTYCDAEDMHELEQVAGMLSTALKEIRDILGTMRPPSFTKQTLTDIIQSVIFTHEAFTDCQVSFQYQNCPDDIPLPTKIALYRICQEALNNAYQHSGSRTQQVTLVYENPDVVLTIKDDGCGFIAPPLDGPEATEREEHIGLRGMRDRIHLVGGTMTLETAPGQGTTIQVKVAIYD